MIASAIVLIVNELLWYEGSSAALSLPTLVTASAVAVCVFFPLSLAGSFVARLFKLGDLSGHEANLVPRSVPTQPWFVGRVFLPLITGIVPYSTIAVEGVILTNAVWRHYVYSSFGFLSVSFLLLIVSSLVVSVLSTYASLLRGDHSWWWCSFAASGTSGLYYFVQCLVAFTKFQFTTTATFVYFSYSLLFSAAVSVLTGFVGFMGSLALVRYLYSDSSGRFMARP